MVAYLTEICKMNPDWISAHFFKKFDQVYHKAIVSLLILHVNGCLERANN
jgi:hypothetical protein